MPPTPNTPSSLARGIDIIQSHLKTLPDRPGVYRMIGADGAVLYVGKAKALKKRVTNYTQPDRLSGRIQRMVSLTTSMEFVETHTETEALLLESNLIKKLNPTYNVLLKDDKMYPSIFIPKNHDFPGAQKYRGPRKADGYYYGPFLSGSAVNESLNILHRVFQIRNCTDSYFAARTRPCLQYHIKRCTAPCVGRVTVGDYAAQIDSARAFLNGKSREVQDDFASKMQAASTAHDYETAAQYRDKIKLLTTMMTKQTINIPGIHDADVIAVLTDRGVTAVQVFFFRAGQNYGNVSYFPKHTEDEPLETIMAAFLGQFYADKIPAPDVIISHDPDDSDMIQAALSDRAGRIVDLSVPKRGARRDVLDFALKNAAEALSRHIATAISNAKLLDSVQELFALPARPNRIEVYDNSHLGGTGQIGAMIVAGPDGFIKNAYRKFNIKTADASDDYGMMREVMTRRFKKTGEASLYPLPLPPPASPINGGGWRGKGGGQGGGQNITDNPPPDVRDAHVDLPLKGGGVTPASPLLSPLPDLILIDGGAGQLSAVREALTAIDMWDTLAPRVVAISKGPDRNAGREWFHRDGHDPVQLPVGDPVLHYLQRLRDESHRFAIGTQRARRTGTITQSILDQIPGIGAKRKKALLLHFGSAKAVADAALDDLAKVPGISKAFAQKLYDYFHAKT